MKLVLTGWLKIEDVPAMLAWSDPKIEELKTLLPLARTEAAVGRAASTAGQLEPHARAAEDRT